MEEGQIILTVFPQDKQKKLRLALLLKQFPKYGDFLVCGISTQLHQYISGLDLLIDEKHPDYKKSSLKAASVCRLSMLTVLTKQDITGVLGALSVKTHSQLLHNFSSFLLERKKINKRNLNPKITEVKEKTVH